MIIPTDLIKRHKEYKKFIINNKIKVGEYWEKIQVDFNSELSKYGWKNLGKQNFFPIKVDNIDQNGVAINHSFIKNDSNNNSYINNNHFYELLKKNTLLSKYKNILEIGAGCGILASLLLQEKKKYFIVDIPNMIVCSSSYLMTIFPDKKYCLPNELTKSDDINEKDIIFITPNQIKFLKDNYFDLIINNQSFQEMNYNEIDAYFYLIKRSLKIEGKFFSSNRLKKETNYFDYPWRILNNFKIEFIRKNTFHIKNNNYLTYLDKLLTKKDTNDKIYNLNPIKKIILLNSFSLKERFFWFKKFLKFIVRSLIGKH